MPWLRIFAMPVAVSLALAFLLGVIFEPVRLDGTPALLVALGACAITAAWVAATVRGVEGVVLGTALGVGVIALMLAIKVARWPDTPVVGNGIGALLVLYGAASFAGAAIGVAASRVARAVR